jgi:hypothetical protein
MPNDPYQIGDTDSGITLVLSDRGVSTPSAHAIQHVSGGNDEIRAATTSLNGLMSADFALKLTNIESGAQLTNSTRIFTALNGVTTATPEGSDSITFLDGTDSALKKVTFTNLFNFLDDTFVRVTGTQSISDTKTFSSVVLTSADINGGTIDGTTINLGTNTFTGQLPVASGGTGLASYSVGSVLYASGSTTLSGLTAVATGNVLISGGVATAPSWGKVGLTTHVSGTLAVGNGGTGSTAAATGTGGVVLANSPTLVTPVLDTPASGLLTNCTGLPLTTGVTGVLPIANGGTSFSQTSYGQISSQTPVLTSVAYTATFTKVDMATTLGSPSSNFSSASSSSRLTYTGTQTRDFLVYASLDMLGDTAGDGYAIRLAKNSTTIAETECRAYAAGKSPDFFAKLVTSWIITLNTNDFLELFAASPGSDNGFPQRMRLIATPI